MERNFALESKKHRLHMKLHDAIDDGEIKEDKHAADAFVKFANQLIAQFMGIYEQQFNVALYEYVCGEDEAHSAVEITSINQYGDDDIDMYMEGATRLSYRQSYLAQNLKDFEESYVGVLKVVVWVPHPSASDGDAVPVENPMAQVLADLAFMQYYRTISQEHRDWRTEYIDAPIPD